MTGAQLLLLLALLLVGLAVAETWVHRRNLRSLRWRIHVNGTRGKSSVTRLIAAGLREGGIVTCAKTTGTLARMILPDGRELPIFRPAGPNVIEQKRIVSLAAEHRAEALVIECMAVAPELQALCELFMVRATHGVITNARPDHLDVMGPTDADVARALCGTVPERGLLFTAEQAQLPVLAAAAADRGSRLVAVGDDAVAAIAPADLAGFSYTEHAENLALALAVCAELGVARDVALAGMQRARPDPGALTEHQLDFFGRQVTFLNAFAANDPVSTARVWNQANDRYGARRRLAIFNCRADRPDRSLQLGSDFVRWHPADHVVLMGSGTYLFARAATAAGFDASRLTFVEDQAVDEIFERIIALCGSSALVVGMGNVGGQGLDLARYFANRAAPAKEPA